MVPFRSRRRPPSVPDPGRVQRGDRYLRESFLNGLAESAEALARSTAPGAAFSFGQFSAPPDTERYYLGKITATDGGSPPKYSWARVREPATDGTGTGTGGHGAVTADTSSVASGGPAVAASTLPAYELNSNPNVPVDGSAVVLLWESWGGECLWFVWPDPGASGAVTFTGAVVFGPTSTLTVTSSSASYGDSTHATNVTVVNGTWSYPATSSVSVAPKGRLVVPTLTVTGPPTYTSTEGELLCGSDGSLYQGTPTGTWVRYIPAPPNPPTSGPYIIPVYDPSTQKYLITNPVTATPGTQVGPLPLPTLTVSGAPTWTPAANEYPLEWNSFDKVLYAWDGAAWNAISGPTSPLTTKGDVWGYDTADARIPIGADGQVLTADSAQTLGLKWAAASAPAGTPAWVKVTKTYSDLSAAGTTNDIEVYSLPAKSVLHAQVMKPSVQFSGGTIASYQINLGVSGTLGKFSPTTLQGHNAVSNTAFVDSEGCAFLPALQNYGAATSIRLSATSGGGNLSAATQGSVDVWLLISTLP